MTALTTHEQQQVERANESGRPPVVFVHGLWLLASSWDPWRELFDTHGYATLAPGWPDDPATVADGGAQPEVFPGKGIAAITAHVAQVIQRLDAKPAIVGHS